MLSCPFLDDIAQAQSGAPRDGQESIKKNTPRHVSVVTVLRRRRGDNGAAKRPADNE
jgi:hypothetical protein